MRERLTAATEAPPLDPKEQAQGQAPKQDPKQAKMIERIKAALPAVGEASAAMDKARDDLLAKQLPPAVDQEQAALDALGRAIEQFSDLKQLVELAYAEHQQLLQLLGPDAAKQLAAAERGKLTRQALGHNLGRMPRLRELIADEVAQLDAKAQQPQAADPKADPKVVEAQQQQAKQQLEQAKQQLARAEELRGQAQTALAALDQAITASHDPLPPAKDADAKLTELRKLFFSVIEHLQELIREQGETHDQTRRQHRRRLHPPAQAARPGRAPGRPRQAGQGDHRRARGPGRRGGQAGAAGVAGPGRPRRTRGPIPRRCRARPTRSARPAPTWPTRSPT